MPGEPPAAVPAPDPTARRAERLRALLRSRARPRPAREHVALALLLLLALGLRLLWLDRVPTTITADEANNLRTIFRIDETGQPGFFGLDWKPAPAFSMYLTRAFMAAFGETVFGLRSASAVLSTLALVPFYALARRVVGPPAALAAAALLASGRWYLHFSRSGWENVHAALYALLAAWALTVALERGRLRWFVAAGAAAALGLYGYYAGRLILPALLAYAPFAWWWARGRHRLVLTGRNGAVGVTALAVDGRRRGRLVLVGFGVLTGTALLLFLPQWRTIRADRAYAERRVAAVYVLDQPRPYLGEETAVGVLGIQLERTVRGFLLLDGRIFANGRYGPPGEPPYDPVTGLLVVVGLGLGLLRHRRATALWACLLAVPLLGTQVLSADTPDAARAVVVAPVLYLFAALAIEALRRRIPGRKAAAATLALGVAVLATVNVASYSAWIRSPQAVDAREPAEPLAGFAAWQAGVRCEIRGGTLAATAEGLHCTGPGGGR